MRTLRECEAGLPLRMRALDKHCNICATLLAIALNDKRQHAPLYIANLYRHYDKAHLRNCRLSIKRELWKAAYSYFRQKISTEYSFSDIKMFFAYRFGDIAGMLVKETFYTFYAKESRNE